MDDYIYFISMAAQKQTFFRWFIHKSQNESYKRSSEA